MTCVICGQPIEEGRIHGQPPGLAKYCLKCRADRRRHAKVKYTWRPEHDAHLRAHYFGGLNRRFQLLSRMVRLTGLPRWYIKRQAARLGLTMHIDRRPWTRVEMELLEKLVGRMSSATSAWAPLGAFATVTQCESLNCAWGRTTTRSPAGSRTAGFRTVFRVHTGTMGTATTFTVSRKRTF